MEGAGKKEVYEEYESVDCAACICPDKAHRRINKKRGKSSDGGNKGDDKPKPVKLKKNEHLKVIPVILALEAVPLINKPSSGKDMGAGLKKPKEERSDGKEVIEESSAGKDMGSGLKKPKEERSDGKEVIDESSAGKDMGSGLKKPKEENLDGKEVIDESSAEKDGASGLKKAKEESSKG